MVLESIDPTFAVHQVTGFPSFHAAEVIEEELLADAGLRGQELPSAHRHSPTTFHIATDERGTPLGVAASTIGPLAELPLGLALVEAGVDLTADRHTTDPACELVSLSVDVDQVAKDAAVGVTEALYRSFYRRARASEARSAVVGVDPWLFDVLTEQYGVPFQVLGPPLRLLGRELLAIGGDLDVLAAGVASASPQFAAYLDLPYRSPAG